MVIFILTILFGWAGFYRFYKRQYFRGILYLITFGLFYIGWIIDIVCALRDMLATPAAPQPAPVPPAMPWILSFAAGAMIYVVVEELIPEAHLGEHSHAGTLSVMAGFLVMMLLDVLLG